MWNDLPYTVLDIGTLDGCKGAVNRWLLNSLSCVFISFPNNFVFFAWASAAGFIIINNNNSQLYSTIHSPPQPCAAHAASCSSAQPTQPRATLRCTIAAVHTWCPRWLLLKQNDSSPRNTKQRPLIPKQIATGYVSHWGNYRQNNTYLQNMYCTYFCTCFVRPFSHVRKICTCCLHYAFTSFRA